MSVHSVIGVQHATRVAVGVRGAGRNAVGNNEKWCNARHHCTRWQLVFANAPWPRSVNPIGYDNNCSAVSFARLTNELSLRESFTTTPGVSRGGTCDRRLSEPKLNYYKLLILLFNNSMNSLPQQTGRHPQAFSKSFDSVIALQQQYFYGSGSMCITETHSPSITQVAWRMNGRAIAADITRTFSLVLISYEEPLNAF